MSGAKSIAVVGSGIGGLAASWYLGLEHQVTLFEKQAQIGMAAHGLEWGGARVDVPLRVLYRGYYPTLTALYAAANIEITAADYSASFSEIGGPSYFRYRNWRLGSRLSIPMLQGGQPWGPRARRIVLDLMRIYRRAGRDSRRLRGQAVSLDRYLQEQNYSREFVEDFLLPTFAAIGTCSTESVRRYPARVVIDYLRKGVLLEGVSRTVRGADFVVQRLSSLCEQLVTSTSITQIEDCGDKLRICDEQGQTREFDHVVIATQGNQAQHLVGQVDSAAAQALSRFHYEPSEVVVHTDTRLMPSLTRNWSPVNFFRDPRESRPMATIWLNAVLPISRQAPAAFQTWNPLIAPHEDRILSQARFERPVVDLQSERGVAELDALHQQPGRRLWFCGSYAQPGVPLLESAARSAQRIARRIDQAP